MPPNDSENPDTVYVFLRMSIFCRYYADIIKHIFPASNIQFLLTRDIASGFYVTEFLFVRQLSQHPTQKRRDVFPVYFPDRWPVVVAAIVKDQFGSWNLLFHLKSVFDRNNLVFSAVDDQNRALVGQ